MIKVSDFIVQYLEQIGITDVFLVTGGGAMHLNDSFGKSRQIRCVYNHHEQACAIAAEGYARKKQQIAVVNVTTGPGGLNTLTGVFGQWTDSVPVLYISGQVRYDTTTASIPELGLRQLGDQEVNIISVVKGLTKYSICISDPLDVKRSLQAAVYHATSGRPGPVWIDVPMNVQGAMVDEASLSDFTVPQIEDRRQSSADSALRVAQMMKSSQRPVIVAGHGVRLSETIQELHKVLEKTQVPVVGTLNGFDVMPFDHPQYIGTVGTIGSRAGNFVLQNADFVLFLGTRNNIRQVSYGWQSYARHAVKVAVDVDEAELKKPLIKYNLAVQDDLRSWMPALSAATRDEVLDFSDWLKWGLDRKNRYGPVLDSYRNLDGCINPYVFMEELSSVIGRDVTVVTGNATACICYFQAARLKEGNRVIWNSGCASMGYDLPAAIGAAVASGDSSVVCLAGDGSFQMNIQELSTIKHNSLSVKIFYLNNDGYISMKQTQDNFFGRRVGADARSGVSFPSCEKIAAAYELPYFRLASEEGLASSLECILRIDGPVICEVVLPSEYNFAPKLSSERKADGRLVSKPLEDMFPFLDRDEFRSNMIVPPIDE